VADMPKQGVPLFELLREARRPFAFPTLQ